MNAAALRLCFALVLGLAGLVAAVGPAPARVAAARDGAQRGAASEWWRLTGHVRARDGRRFALAATFFRFAVRGTARRPWPGASAWSGGEFFPATFALVDERERRYLSATRVERGAFGFGRAEAGGLDVAAGPWSLRAAAPAPSGAPVFDVHVESGGTTVDLRQVALKPRVAFGARGIVRSGSCAGCVEHAFAYTRLHARGTVRIDGVAYAVEGTTWLDHEFGSHELAPGDAGWDRFSIQLDDGRDVLVRVVRRADGTPSPATSGELVARNGALTNLGAADVAVATVAKTTWRSRASGTVYPVLWQLIVPKAHLDLAVVPPFEAQEIVSMQGGPAYYEGSVDVERAPPPGGDPGTGFVELTGYRRPLTGL